MKLNRISSFSNNVNYKQSSKNLFFSSKFKKKKGMFKLKESYTHKKENIVNNKGFYSPFKNPSNFIEKMVF